MQGTPSNQPCEAQEQEVITADIDLAAEDAEREKEARQLPTYDLRQRKGQAGSLWLPSSSPSSKYPKQERYSATIDTDIQ